MRGEKKNHDRSFNYASAETRVPADHPLRSIRRLVSIVLDQFADAFRQLYSTAERPSIPPEKLLRAMLLQVLYSLRNEQLLMEQLDYNVLFRWFVGLSLDDAVWNHSVFARSRDQMLVSEVAADFFREVRDLARKEGLLSNECFMVNEPLLENWASAKRQQTEKPD